MARKQLWEISQQPPYESDEEDVSETEVLIQSYLSLQQSPLQNIETNISTIDVNALHSDLGVCAKALHDAANKSVTNRVVLQHSTESSIKLKRWTWTNEKVECLLNNIV